MTGMAIFWLVLLILFLLAEGATAALTTLWFAAGSLVAMLVAVFHGPLWLQSALFALVSLALLWALRPILKKYIKPKMSKTNIDALIGQTAVVTETIDNLNGTGRVKLNGMDWSAKSAKDSIVEAGSIVKIQDIRGVRVFVEPVSTPVEIK